MRSRGTDAQAPVRAATALAVAIIATLGAMRLFSFGFGQSTLAPLTQYMAGREMRPADIPAESVEPATDPIVIETSLDRPVQLASILVDAGLSRDEARQWADLFREQSRTTSVLARGHELVLFRD